MRASSISFKGLFFEAAVMSSSTRQASGRAGLKDVWNARPPENFNSREIKETIIFTFISSEK